MKKILLFALMLTMGMVAKAADCQDGPYGLQINGSKVVDAPKFGDPDAQGRVQYKASCVELQAGDKIKLINKSCGATWMVDIDQYGEYQKFEGGKAAGELTCKADGNYDFYIKLSATEGDLVYIGPAESCGGEYTSAVPTMCPDVMLQAFYWESYEDEVKGNKTEIYGRTKWVDFLNKKTDEKICYGKEIGQWFDLVWFPPMSASSGGTGYHPIQYSNLKSAWGEQRNLQRVIDTLHTYGARVVADMVINHAEGQNGWCSFADQNFGSYGKFSPTPAWICQTDEMNTSDKAGSCKGKATGANDDGYGSEANYPDARDWDHTNADVRAMFNAYMLWMRNEIKVDGFRYDYCKGFNNGHINDYNVVAKPYISVMEYWDGNVDALKYQLGEAKWNTMTFDFAIKYTAFNNGIGGGNYGALKGAGLLGAGNARYSVTFLDNHDTFLRKNDEGYSSEFMGYGNSMNYPGKIQQCYAYMLSMPGIPCVFYPHWVTFKDQLKAMINARYKTGVHSESSVSDEAGDGYYKATITGTNGQIRLLVGPNSGYGNTPDGFTKAIVGDGYGVYYKLYSPRGDKNTEREPIVQGIEEVTSFGPAAKGQKFLKDGKLLIKVGEKVYDVMGREIRN